MQILINTMSLLLAGGAGAFLGWLYCQWKGEQSSSKTAAKAKENLKQAIESVQKREDQTDGVLYHLTELAENICFEVEEHQEQVISASDALRGTNVNTQSVMEIVAEILTANDSLQKRLHQAEEKLQEQAQVIQTHVKEARTDSLTQVANRRAFDSELAEARTQLSTHKIPSTLMMLDVDRFKKFNDQHGHLAGDEVLKVVGRLLRRSLKQGGQVFRYGGEEFSVIFRNRNLKNSLSLAERLRNTIGRQSIEFDGEKLDVTVSAGVCQILKDESSEDVIQRADSALYEAKQRGRDRLYWNDGQKNQLFEAPEPDPQDLSRAVANDGSPDDSQESGKGTSWRDQVSTREEFQNDVYRRIAERKRSGGIDAVILMRVDELASIRHSRGKEAENLVMRATAQFLKASVRDMDHVALYDEDKFAVWLPTANLENTSKIASRLRSAVARCKIPSRKGALTFTVSLGFSQTETGDTLQSILERTEKALNYASQRGGNRCYAARESSFALVNDDAPLRFE